MTLFIFEVATHSRRSWWGRLWGRGWCMRWLCKLTDYFMLTVTFVVLYVAVGRPAVGRRPGPGG